MWKQPTQHITNTAQFCSPRRFGPSPLEDSVSPQPQPSNPASGHFRQLPDEGTVVGIFSQNSSKDPGGLTGGVTHTRPSRWGDSPYPPSVKDGNGIPHAHLDLSSRIHVLRGDINRLETERSLSPPPIYDATSRRLNVLDSLSNSQVDGEKSSLLYCSPKGDLLFHPHAGHHPPKPHRSSDKVYIPVKEFPEINFFGLLVGPRGNSLKKIERDSGAKVSIRGKGSVKEGKCRSDQNVQNAEEELHCLVLADTPEKVASCVRMINKVIETAVSTPEGQNDHKRNQLRELAALNGTLRDDGRHQHSGGISLRQYDFPDHSSGVTICKFCGNAGYSSCDCQHSETVTSTCGGGGLTSLYGHGYSALDSDYTNNFIVKPSENIVPDSSRSSSFTGVMTPTMAANIFPATSGTAFLRRSTYSKTNMNWPLSKQRPVGGGYQQQYDLTS